jgi:hypothetical protein
VRSDRSVRRCSCRFSRFFRVLTMPRVSPNIFLFRLRAFRRRHQHQHEQPTTRTTAPRTDPTMIHRVVAFTTNAKRRGCQQDGHSCDTEIFTSGRWTYQDTSVACTTRRTRTGCPGKNSRSFGSWMNWRRTVHRSNHCKPVLCRCRCWRFHLCRHRPSHRQPRYTAGTPHHNHTHTQSCESCESSVLAPRPTILSHYPIATPVIKSGNAEVLWCCGTTATNMKSPTLSASPHFPSVKGKRSHQITSD